MQGRRAAPAAVTDGPTTVMAVPPAPAPSASGWVRRGEQRMWTGGALEVVRTRYSTPYGHHRELDVVQTCANEVACLVADHEDRVALALTFGMGSGTQGWSLPSAWLADGEDLLAAAERSVRDVLGWSVHGPRPMWRLYRWPGRSDLLTTVIVARARQAQSRQHPDVDAVDWFTRTEALGLLRAGHGFDAVTIAVLHWWVTEGRSA